MEIEKLSLQEFTDRLNYGADSKNPHNKRDSDAQWNLREIPDPPESLWLRGYLPTSDTKLLAVVGSRALTRYGREATEMLISGLTGYPISIVSGLALGADAAAHKAALDAGLHTIAIPGGGVDDVDRQR